MPEWNVLTRAHVLTALGEYDQLGDREFFRRYAFGRAHAYKLWHSGRDYDSQVITGVAYLHATGTVLTPRELASERDASARVLNGLGFDVVVDEELAAQHPAPKPPPVKAPAVRATAARPSATAGPRPARKAAAAPTKRVTKPEPTYTFCPTCYTAVPATGICDFCD